MKNMEILYWVAVIAAAGLALWRHRRKPTDAEFKRGENDGKSYLEAGVFPASILSYIEVQQSRGLTGPYERGLKHALKSAQSKEGK